MEKPGPVSARELMALAVVMAVALLLRLRHFDMLLPWFVYLDETRTTEVALYLLRNCTIDTSYTFYPALAFYVNAIGFLGWAVFGHLGTFLAQGADAVFAIFHELSAQQPEAILVSRGVSLVFAMGAIVFTHLLARQYLEWRWALACTLLVALNSMHISVSVLGKVDAINLFWMCAAYYAGVKYWRGERLLRWLVPASVFAGFSLVTKNNYQLCVVVGVLALMNGLQEKESWYRFFVDTLHFPFVWVRALLGGRKVSLKTGEAQVWVFLVVVFAAAFIGSPYTFIRFQDTLVTAGWLYKQAEIISTYHIPEIFGKVRGDNDSTTILVETRYVLTNVEKFYSIDNKDPREYLKILSHTEDLRKLLYDL
ncbi:MAG: glycosyltransferase family 39 protein [bacterium]